MTPQLDPTKYTAYQHPGKFEGESPECEYYWEQMLEGDGEGLYDPRGSEDNEDDLGFAPGEVATLFHVDAEESDAFNLPIGATYMIREDSQGFVYGSCHANREDAERRFRQWLGLEDSK